MPKIKWVDAAVYPLFVFVSFLVFLPSAQAGAGEDFSNNLFTDLAPILALFGEQVAKQFLSHSTSWLDCLIFAANPISIITGATSAIRVGGSRWLKSVIGRAGEAEATAELELMSSTSSDVCELWNGVGVVRVVGAPEILELIYCTNDTDGSAPLSQYSGSSDCSAEVYTLDEAKKAGLFTLKGGGHSSTPEAQTTDPPIGEAENQSHSPPNIFRNTSVTPVSNLELILVAIIGVILQAGVLVYDGAITYDPRWKKGRDGSPPPNYAFPLTFVGTLLVVIGMFICAMVIDVRTDEERWQATGHAKRKDLFQVVWLQRCQLVGDQTFGSFAIYAPKNQQVITTSRKSQYGLARLQFWSLWGSVASIIGFVLQFVGLRNMHWSASIAQLIATGAMTILRVVIRRHLSALPIVHPLPEGFELDFMAKAITKCESWQILPISDSGHLGDPNAISETSAFASRVLHTRMRLQELVLWRTECSEVADQVAQTIQALMDHFFEAEGEVFIAKSASQASDFSWTMPVTISRTLGEERGDISLKLHRASTEGRWAPWGTDRGELEALISLWVSHFRQLEFDSNLWIIGPHNIFTTSSYNWWIYRGTNSIRIQNLRDVCEENQVCHNRVLRPASKPPLAIDFDTTQTYSSNEEILSIITKTSLQQMCGQHLLGVFLSNVTDIIDNLKGKTDVVPGVGGGSYTLVNESVRKIAEIVQRYGLAGVEDSYRLVVPPLCHNNKLTDPFDDRDVLRRIISIQHSNPDTTPDQQLIAYRQLIDFCIAKSTLLSEKDYWRAAREAFLQLISVSQEVLGAYHSCTTEAAKAMKDFAVAFVDANDPCGERSGHSDNLDGAFRLHSAAAKGDLRLTHRLLEGGIGVDIWNVESRTSLSLAIEHGRTNVGRLLIFYGANIDDATSIEEIGNKRGDRQDEVTKMLLLNWGGMSLLHKAAANGYDIVLETLLAENGVDVSAKDKGGWAALHYASKYGHQTTIKLLIDNGADPAAKCPDGQTALHLAVKSGHQAVIRLLAKNGVSVNTHNRDGQTALHVAATNGLDAMVKELMDNGADLTSEDNDKRTALQLAVMNNHETVARQLIVGGADLTARDKNGLTALHSICASDARDTRIIELLLEKGADMTAKDIWGGSPLETAAESGNVPALKLLMAKGADPRCRNNTGRTALESAVRKGQFEVVELLIEDGIDLKNKDGFGRTALHYAAMEGYETIVSLLVGKGFDINATDIDGWTPLHYASRNRHRETAKILRGEGADESIKDRKGQTASYYSTRRMGNAVYWLRALGG